MNPFNFNLNNFDLPISIQGPFDDLDDQFFPNFDTTYEHP